MPLSTIRKAKPEGLPAEGTVLNVEQFREFREAKPEGLPASLPLELQRSKAEGRAEIFLTPHATSKPQIPKG
jgi:hypothetical protein